MEEQAHTEEEETMERRVPPPPPAQRMQPCQKEPQLRFPTSLAALSYVRIQPTRATTQEQADEEKKMNMERRMRRRRKS